MPLDGSPKKFAEDVAAGLTTVNRMMLKRFTLLEIQKILGGLETFSKTVRTEAVETADYEALKSKGLKTQRLNSAMMVVRTYVKETTRTNAFEKKEPVR